MFKMKTAKTPEKYTVEHIGEITDRIIALRVRWLRHVETQLASQQSRPILDHYKLNAEPAE
jgi:malonyl CoA-acyl carrier protein transacylase